MALPIYVQARGSEAPVAVEIAADATVGDLRTAAAEACGLPRGKIRIGGQDLDDDSLPIGDAGLAAECLVELDAGQYVHVLWANYRENISQKRVTGEDSDGDEEVQQLDEEYWMDHIKTKHRRLCAVDGKGKTGEVEMSAEVAAWLAGEAADWHKTTGLPTDAPLHPEVTLRQLVQNCLYGEGTPQRAKLQAQLVYDRDPVSSDDEPLTTVVPRHHIFVPSTWGRPSMGSYIPASELILRDLAVTSGRWYYEVTIRYAAKWDSQIGWRWVPDPATAAMLKEARVQQRKREDKMYEDCEDDVCSEDEDLYEPTCRLDQPWQYTAAMRGCVVREPQQGYASDDSYEEGGAPPPEPSVVFKDADGKEWSWREGDTLATAIDLDNRRILLGKPGQGWTVSHSDIKSPPVPDAPELPSEKKEAPCQQAKKKCAKSKKAARAAQTPQQPQPPPEQPLRFTPFIRCSEALYEVNLGERPLACPPPDPSFRPLAQAAPGAHYFACLEDSDDGESGCSAGQEKRVMREGNTMPERGRMKWAEYLAAHKEARRRKTEARENPAHPFDDGWLPSFEMTSYMKDQQWAGVSEPEDSDESDDEPSSSGYDGDAVAAAHKRKGLALLVAASMTDASPGGSEILGAVSVTAAALRPKAESRHGRKRMEWYKRHREAGLPPILPFKAYNLRTGFARPKRQKKRPQPSRTTGRLKWDVPLARQGVQEHDLIYFLSRDAELEEEEEY
eukprot:TRINITY_DN16386_c0_g1_i1.p1 TRINITY_DN16386_c0_g1~~TRINITY_DN16386_c0_g1_i1.p1  ORF type:complete len:761 (+),score=202.34 TRINITY_DN16386_c0_g1_i1:99-2285(+)